MMSDDFNQVSRANQPVIIPDGKPAGVAEKEREGVFVNGFVCQHCGLHFNLFSWKANRHRTANTYCPECGTRGCFIHYRKVLSTGRVRDKNSQDEIFKQVPLPGSKLMEDSVIFSQK